MAKYKDFIYFYSQYNSEQDLIQELVDIVNDKFYKDYFQIDNTYPFVVKFTSEQAAKNFVDCITSEWENLKCSIDKEFGKIVTVKWNLDKISKIQKTQSYYSKPRTEEEVTESVEPKSCLQECIEACKPDDVSIFVFGKVSDGNDYGVNIKLDGKDVLEYLLNSMNYPSDLDMSVEQKSEYEDCFKDEYTNDDVDYAVVEFLKRNYNGLVDCNKEKISNDLTKNTKYTNMLAVEADKEMKRSNNE